MRKVPRILCERYELLDVLGKGAHGRIYLATDLVTHERVAIKLVSIYYQLLAVLFSIFIYRHFEALYYGDLPVFMIFTILLINLYCFLN